MSTETISISDLEEMLSNNLPCGGNITPKKRPCPHNAEAILVSSHNCPMGQIPQDLKCFSCYEIWRASNNDVDRVRCPSCGWIGSIFGLYRPL